MKIVNLLKRALDSLYLSVRRFPVTISLSTALTLLLIILTHKERYLADNSLEIIKRLTMVIAMGIPISLSIKLVFERNENLNIIYKLSAYIIEAIFLTVYYIFLLDQFEMVQMTRYIALSTAFYLAFIFIPYFYRREGFELYIVKLLTRGIVTLIYSLVLFLGIAAILFTVDKLLGITIQGEIYADTFLLVAGIFAPCFFLSGVPLRAQQFETEDYPKLLKVLLLYIVMPIITAYTAILYIYFFKVIITRQWPVGLVAHLVLWYSIISTGIIFLVSPVKENKWVKAFSFWFIKLVIPLIIMMYVSIGIRVKAFGITENRYFVILMGLWVLGITIYLNLSRAKRNIILPISLAVIAVIAVCGPLSSYSVSKFSQNKRFESIVEKYHMIKDGKIVKPESEISNGDKREITEIIHYFSNNHKLKDIKYLPPNFITEDMPEVFGFKYEYGYRQSDWNQYFSYYAEIDSKPLEIGGYSYLFDIRGNQPLKSTSDNKLEVKLDNETYQIKVMSGNKELYNKNLSDFVKKIYDIYGTNNSKTIKPEDMVFVDENQNIKVKYVFRNMYGNIDETTKEIKINNMEFLMLVDIK